MSGFSLRFLCHSTVRLELGGAWLSKKGFERVEEIAPGETLIEGDGKTIYNAGDTDLFDGMRDLGPVDVALLPVWGWGPNLGPGHLDPARAALVQARAAVPVHWGTLALPGLRRTARMRRLLADPPRVFAAEATLGYPAVFGGVLLGSIVPVVPTGAVVGAAAAVATTTGTMSLPLVIVLSTLGAYLGDVVTFGIPRLGSEAAFRWISRRQPAERLEKAREQFARRGRQLVVTGRLVPAAVGALVSSLLAVDEDEIFFRRAIRDGDMPTFAAWLAEDSHTLNRWHTDWSSQTEASVCGILHGSNHDILGFRWYEKDRDHVMACAHPADALRTRELAFPGEVVGAEARHRVFRGWLTELGHTRWKPLFRR